jgi:lipopolysaccharide export system protein LptC
MIPNPHAHTLFVRRLKKGLLAAAGVMFLALVIWPLAEKLKSGGDSRISWAYIEQRESGETAMINPHFQGLDKRNRPYNITADKAIQVDDVTVELQKMHADMITDNNGWYSLTAKEGRLALERKTMDVLGDVTILSHDGIDLRTEALHVNVGLGTVSGIEPVVIKHPSGTLNAHGISMEKEARKIRFDGPVSLIVYPKTIKSKGDRAS